MHEFVTVDAQGLVTLERIRTVADLDGNSYRDDSFEYYVNERVAEIDYKVIPLSLYQLNKGMRNEGAS